MIAFFEWLLADKYTVAVLFTTVFGIAYALAEVGKAWRGK